MLIRPEEERHWPSVYAVNAAVFETPAEADLVDALRREPKPMISLVHDDAGEIVGHIMLEKKARLNRGPDFLFLSQKFGYTVRSN